MTQKDTCIWQLCPKEHSNKTDGAPVVVWAVLKLQLCRMRSIYSLYHFITFFSQQPAHTATEGCISQHPPALPHTHPWLEFLHLFVSVFQDCVVLVHAKPSSMLMSLWGWFLLFTLTFIIPSDLSDCPVFFFFFLTRLTTWQSSVCFAHELPFMMKHCVSLIFKSNSHNAMFEQKALMLEAIPFRCKIQSVHQSLLSRRLSLSNRNPSEL